MRYREIREALDASKTPAWQELGAWLTKYAGDDHIWAYLPTKLYNYLRRRDVANPSTKDQQWYNGILNQCASELHKAFPNMWQFEREESWVRAYMNGGKIGDRPGKTYLTFADPEQGLSRLPAFLLTCARTAPKATMQFKLQTKFADFYQDVDNLVIHYPIDGRSLMNSVVMRSASLAQMQLTDRESVHRSEEGRDTNESDSTLIVNNIIAVLKANSQWQTVIKTDPHRVATWIDQVIKHQMDNASHREFVKDPWFRKAA